MRGKQGVFVWIIALILIFSVPAFAEEPASAEPPVRLRAVLIGCDHFLSQPDTWPAAETNLRLLSDTLSADTRRYALIRAYSSSLSSPEAFEEAVLSSFQNAEARDISVLYISTHGLFGEGESTDQAALLLSDGEQEARLDAATLQRVLDQIPGTKLVILDACNAGAVIGKGVSGGAEHAYLTGPDYKVLCSAGGSEASWYFQGGTEPTVTGASYFATVLCSGLGLQGDFGADLNADGQITLTELYRFLRDNYAASTPQVYPQTDGDFPVLCYDPDLPRSISKAITDITFEDTLLTAGESAVSFSFTVQRQAELYYQIIYHQNGAWQFDQAQHFLDGEQADGSILPGRKLRTLSLNTGNDAYGYAMIQLITLENGSPVFQGARLLCVRPSEGSVALHVETAPAFSPDALEELSIFVQHNVPCGLTVSILNEAGKTVRRLAYEEPTRPQHLTPSGSSFFWDGRLASGETAPAGLYTVQVKTRLNGETFLAESAPFELKRTELILLPNKK